MPKNSFFTLIVLTTYFLILLFISVLICQTIHIFMPRVFLSLFQPLNTRQWSRQNFSLQYQYNIRQTSDENKEKYISQPPWQFLDRVFNGMPKNSFFTLIVLTTYFLILLFISVLICQTIHIFMPRVFLSLFQPLNTRQWSRQNFSLQYQYNIRQTSDENKEKYQLGDYLLIQYQILKIHIIRIYSRQ